MMRTSSVLLLLVLAVLAAIPSSPARAIPCIDYGDFIHQVAYGRLPEGPSAAAMSGSNVYLATQAAFYVVDISDARNPRIAGSAALSEIPRAIAIEGEYAFVAADTMGLEIVRISDPSVPQVVTQIDVGGRGLDVAVDGGIACVATGEDGMSVIDVHDPTTPVLVGHLNTPHESALRVDVRGTHAYLAMGHELKVIDIADPRHPRIIGNVIPNGSAVDVAAAEDGDRVYVADRNVGIDVVDFPGGGSAAPRVQTVPISGGAVRVNVVGSRVFALSGDDFGSTLSVADTRLFSVPRIIGETTVQGGLNDFCAGEAYACVAGGWYGFSIIEVSRPASPPGVGSLHAFSGALTVAVRGDYAYLGYPYYQYFWTADISNPYHPRARGVLTGMGWGAAIALRGNYAIVAARSEGMIEVDISDPAHPALLGTWRIVGNASDVAVYGNYALFANGSLCIVDVSTPSNPVVVRTVVPPGGVGTVQVFDQYAYVTGGHFLNILDLTDTANPTIVASVDLGHSVGDATVTLGHAYVLGGGGIDVLDVADPANPVYVTAVPQTDGSSSITAHGSHLFCCAWWRGVMIYDVTDPAHPFQSGSVDTPDYCYCVAVTDDLIYVADGSALEIYHGQCDGEAGAAAIAGRMGAGPTGASPAGRSPVDPSLGDLSAGSSAPRLLLRGCAPNPFRTETSVAFVSGTRAETIVQVFSPAGRLVRTLVQGEYGAGEWRIPWDGRTDAGRPAPPGAYYIRLTQDGVSRSGRVTLVR